MFCQLNEYYTTNTKIFTTNFNGSNAENENRESQGYCNFYLESLRVYSLPNLEPKL